MLEYIWIGVNLRNLSDMDGWFDWGWFRLKEEIYCLLYAQMERMKPSEIEVDERWVLGRVLRHIESSHYRNAFVFIFYLWRDGRWLVDALLAYHRRSVAVRFECQCHRKLDQNTGEPQFRNRWFTKWSSNHVVRWWKQQFDDHAGRQWASAVHRSMLQDRVNEVVTQWPLFTYAIWRTIPCSDQLHTLLSLFDWWSKPKRCSSPGDWESLAYSLACAVLLRVQETAVLVSMNPKLDNANYFHKMIVLEMKGALSFQNCVAPCKIETCKRMRTHAYCTFFKRTLCSSFSFCHALVMVWMYSQQLNKVIHIEIVFRMQHLVSHSERYS